MVVAGAVRELMSRVQRLSAADREQVVSVLRSAPTDPAPLRSVVTGLAAVMEAVAATKTPDNAAAVTTGPTVAFGSGVFVSEEMVARGRGGLFWKSAYIAAGQRARDLRPR